jgi:hypothetical protein
LTRSDQQQRSRLPAGKKPLNDGEDVVSAKCFGVRPAVAGHPLPKGACAMARVCVPFRGGRRGERRGISHCFENHSAESRCSAGVSPAVAGGSRSRARAGCPRYGERDFHLYGRAPGQCPLGMTAYPGLSYGLPRGRERVKKSMPVILSEAKDLCSFFRLNDIRKTAKMLRFAQHHRIGFFHRFRGPESSRTLGRRGPHAAGAQGLTPSP